MTISADRVTHWTDGPYEAWLLQGNCTIAQGKTTGHSTDGMVWIDRGDPFNNETHKVIAYLEGDVLLRRDEVAQTSRLQIKPELRDQRWLGRFETFVTPDVKGPTTVGEPAVKPGVYERAVAARNPIPDTAIRQTQFMQAAPTLGGAVPGGNGLVPPGSRRVRAFARSNTPVQAQMFPNPGSNEWVAVINSGVNLIIDGLAQGGTIDISTDRLVVWTAGLNEPDFSGQQLQRSDTPLEIYMEGNIEFRQGDRLIRANAMYYDVRREVGTILSAEALTPLPKYAGLVRLKADVLQQVERNKFIGHNALFTTSRIGDPTYALDVKEIEFTDNQRPVLDAATGMPLIDPVSGQPVVEHESYASSKNNFVDVDGVPILYFPYFAGDVSKPIFYIERFVIKNDNVFGFQVLTDFDVFQILGYDEKPKGLDWTASFDYFSKRGPAVGTRFSYDQMNLFDIPGPTKGFIDGFYVHDDGRDNLGQDRSALIPPSKNRGWAYGQHRQELPDDWVFSAELGYVSDRNFLEQWQQRVWDTQKDLTTGLELKKYKDNASISLTADVRINDFFTQTNWLPRLDHYWIGESFFEDTLTWFEHSSVGYAQLRRANPPTDPNDAPFSYEVWEQNEQGLRASTRQELDLPVQLGPVKVVPYAEGEFTHWGEDLTGSSLDRVYGQFGVRASLPFWAVNPFIQDDLFNVHGIAHKVTLDAEFAYADANQSLNDLPLYDPIDDDAQEHFRNRLANIVFGTPNPVPQRFDERFYALRSGLAGNVSSPSTEIAGDLMAARLGVHQRWQTKRGPEDDRHTIDWITLDTEVTYFPKDDRDNYGVPFGLANYDFRWLVGERVTLTSDGTYDFFSEGQKETAIGAFLAQPPRGTIFLGFRSLEGPITADILTTSFIYRMSPKWVSALSTSIDFDKSGAVSQSLLITRVGESFLTTFGVNVQDTTGTVGAVFLFEPRFMPRTHLSSGGLTIPDAGVYGIE
ncbi:MAG TPA: organic solvent tolerance protein OstA [Pirellulales bacterium]|nr:organic solvent tolerance protein OstA [Pirellulales bacterium]